MVYYQKPVFSISGKSNMIIIELGHGVTVCHDFWRHYILFIILGLRFKFNIKIIFGWWHILAFLFAYKELNQKFGNRKKSMPRSGSVYSIGILRIFNTGYEKNWKGEMLPYITSRGLSCFSELLGALLYLLKAHLKMFDAFELRSARIILEKIFF